MSRNGGENASCANIDVRNEYSKECGVDKLESYDYEHLTHSHAPYQWTRLLAKQSNRSGALRKSDEYGLFGEFPQDNCNVQKPNASEPNQIALWTD